MYLLCADNSYVSTLGSMGMPHAMATFTPIALFSTKEKCNSFMNKLIDYVENAGDQGYNVCTDFEILEIKRIPTNPANITRAMKKKLKED